jgi:hypothetical protein
MDSRSAKEALAPFDRPLDSRAVLLTGASLGVSFSLLCRA